MNDILVRLPWPPAKTSKNASRQGDWRGKASAARAYRDACMWECKRQGIDPRGRPEGHVPVTITYCPPTAARFDWDNMAGRAKQGFDAVAEAAGIDDGRWWPVTCERGPKVKGGAVLVHIHTEPRDTWQHIGDVARDLVKGEIE